jgi:WD40-like Beta Propeller Repeat
MRRLLLCASLLFASTTVLAQTPLQPHPILDDGGKVFGPSPGFDMVLNAGFAPDGHTVYFTQATHGWTKIQLFTASVAGDRWSAVTPIPFSDPRYRDTDPAVSADGNTIVFASDRPLPGQTYKQYDYHLWTVQKTNDGWSDAHLLEGPANTLAPVLYPALDGKGTLYFMHIANSAAQIYQSAPTPQALSFAGVNSALDESISPDGSKLAFVGAVQGDDGKPHGKLFVADRDGDVWNAKPIAIDGLRTGPSATAFSRDGRRIYFAASVNSGDAAKPGIYYVEAPT